MSFDRNFDNLVNDDDTDGNQHRQQSTQFHIIRRINGQALRVSLSFNNKLGKIHATANRMELSTNPYLYEKLHSKVL